MRISQEAFERMVDGYMAALANPEAAVWPVEPRPRGRFLVEAALREADVEVGPEPAAERLVRENADAAMSPGPAAVGTLNGAGLLRVVGSLANASELLVSDGSKIYGLRVREVGK